MKRNNTKGIFKTAIALLLAMSLALGIGFSVAAEDSPVGENPIEVTSGGENTTDVEEGVEDTTRVDTDGNEGADSGDNSHFEEENSTDTDKGEEEGGDLPQNEGENTAQSGEYEINLFEQIYTLIEANADKIFSVLAFIGTLIVGVGYKSGLLPLLRDALSKLKGAIDGVKADGESTKALTDGKLNEISAAVEKIQGELSDMKWQYESYEEICRDREALHLILSGQIDMLYSIFMTSALPQYQKDEVGERISEMREVLKCYESSKEN